MHEWLIIYNHLPSWLKNSVASLYGFRLKMIRYSKDTNNLATNALTHEKWSPDQWRIYQDGQLAKVLWHAAKYVPYYHSIWQNRRQRGDKSSVELLQNWPVLKKETLRAHPKAFIHEGTRLSSQVSEHTSGTTGKPLKIWMSIDAVRQWYALFEARWRGWYGLSRYDRWGILGGQLVIPISQSKPPFWVWNAGLNQLYFSSYHLVDKNIAAYLEAIQYYKLVYLWGYASSLYSIAQIATDQKLNIPSLRIVISNAEPLYNHQREVISQAFDCPVVDTYGLSEEVCAASECQYGRLHLWPEVGVTEIFHDKINIPVSPGETGRIICTGLLNSTMPLIRYEVGDRGFLLNDLDCACGRKLPILGSVEGRIDDLIITPDGKRIGRLDPVYKADLPIRESQIIQEDLHHVRVKIVPTEGFGIKDEEDIIQRIQQRLGRDIEVTTELVKKIPRTQTGKFKAVISKLK
jgi:phenylacetate-CoA ligase